MSSSHTTDHSVRKVIPPPTSSQNPPVPQTPTVSYTLASSPPSEPSTPTFSAAKPRIMNSPIAAPLHQIPPSPYSTTKSPTSATQKRLSEYNSPGRSMRKDALPAPPLTQFETQLQLREEEVLRRHAELCATQKELDSVNLNLEQSRNLVEAQRDEISRLRESLKQVHIYEAAVEEEKAKATNAMKRAEHAETRVTAREDEYKLLLIQYNTLVQRLGDVDKEKQHLQDRIIILEQNSNATLVDKDITQRELMQTHALISSEQAKAEKMFELYEKKANENAQLRNALQEAAEYRNASDREIQRLNDQLNDLRSCVELHQKTMEDIDTTQTNLMHRMEELVVERDEAVQGAKIAEARMEPLDKDNSRLRDVLAALRNEAGGLDPLHYVKQLKAELHNMMSSRNDAVTSIQKTCADLQSKTEMTMEEERKQYRETIARLEQREAEIVAKLRQRDDEIRVLNDRLMDANRRKDESDRDAFALRESLKHVESVASSSHFELSSNLTTMQGDYTKTKRRALALKRRATMTLLQFTSRNMLRKAYGTWVRFWDIHHTTRNRKHSQAAQRKRRLTVLYNALTDKGKLWNRQRVFCGWQRLALEGQLVRRLSTVVLMAKAYRKFEALVDRSRAVIMLRKRRLTRTAFKMWFRASYHYDTAQRVAYPLTVRNTEKRQKKAIFTKWKSICAARIRLNKNINCHGALYKLVGNILRATCTHNVGSLFFHKWVQWSWSKRLLRLSYHTNALKAELSSDRTIHQPTPYNITSSHRSPRRASVPSLESLRGTMIPRDYIHQQQQQLVPRPLSPVDDDPKPVSFHVERSEQRSHNEPQPVIYQQPPMAMPDKYMDPRNPRISPPRPPPGTATNPHSITHPDVTPDRSRARQVTGVPPHMQQQQQRYIGVSPSRHPSGAQVVIHRMPSTPYALTTPKWNDPHHQ